MDKIIEYISELKEVIHGEEVSEEDIIEAEKKLGLKFSSEYKNYLSFFGCACIDGSEYTGITMIDRLDVVGVTTANKKLYVNIPNDFYVIEELCIDGIVVWQNNKGNVYLSDSKGKYEQVADSMLEYLKKKAV